MALLRPFLTAACALALAVPAAAPGATVPVRVGIGDQSASIFDQRRFQDLDIQRVRLFVKWNAIDDQYLLQQADQFVDAATRSGATVFMVPTAADLAARRGRLPAPGAYRRKVGALVQRYRRRGVREWGVFNEANRGGGDPRRAARLFTVMRGLCPNCTIVALDVLEQPGAAGFVARFFAALPPRWDRRAQILGVHNYAGVNRQRIGGTRRIIRAARARGRSPAARFWITESGGLVSSPAYACDERRAADRIRFLFSSARKLQADVDRLYVYAYWGNDCRERFDAGLVDADGRPRPGYRAFKQAAASFLR